MGHLTRTTAMTDVRILSEPLGGSPLSRALQLGHAPASWLAEAPRTADAWGRRARDRASAREWSGIWSMLEPALAATGAAAERLERVRRGGGVVVTTGQQPGLFGGPVYTWSKALGALAFADALEQATGLPTAAIFWAATDDADFAEASSTLVARTGGVDLLRATLAPPPGTPMALAPVGDLRAQLALLAGAAGSGSDHRALDAARAAYGDPGRSMGDAYVALLRALLGPLGMPVLDASHPAVAEVARPTVERAMRHAVVIERTLADRSKEIRMAGHAPQVEDMPGQSLVFVRTDGVKRRLSIEKAATAGPTGARFTPNVLLRPIVEREILPTVAYLAGPGELAYFAQVSAVASAMELDAPAALPRWSCTLLEPHIDAALQRLGLQRDAFDTPHTAERLVARASMSEATASGLRALRGVIDQLPVSLGAEPAALGLDRAMGGAGQALHHRLNRLERRLLAGIARRESDRMRDVATIRAALTPNGQRQERAINLIPILARHGLDLLSEMRHAAGEHARALVSTPAPVAQPLTVA